MRQGFVREPEDIKYLILYCLSLLPIAIREEDLLDVVMIDDGFGYFEFIQCFKDLIETKHISEIDVSGGKQYVLTVKGQQIVELTSGSLRSSVKDRAQAAAIRVVRKIRRADSIRASHVKNEDGTFTVTLAVCDKSTAIASMSMLVYTEQQCAMLENNFKHNAESILKGFFSLLLDEGSKREEI